VEILATLTTLICSALLAAEPPARASQQPQQEDSPDVAQEPEGGTGVSPIELVPRVELRQTYQKLGDALSLHDTTAQVSIQFLRRILLRYEVPHRTVSTPDGSISGFGDTELGAVGILASNAQLLVGLIGGAVFDTATRPELGLGKQQVLFGVGGAYKPRRWILGYLVVQEQLSVGGRSARRDINVAAADAGAILFGKQYSWIKADVLGTLDFEGPNTTRLFGTLELGSLVVGRVGLFVRAGTQLIGPTLLDYSLAGGVRYLFRLEKGRPRS
jgi:hypothetical protein